MSIEFVRKGKELILLYHPEMVDSETLLQQIKDKGTWEIKHCFTVSLDRLRHNEAEFDSFIETVCFCIGSVGSKYTKIDRDVVGTKNVFYFANEIDLKEKMFIACRNISILGKFDQVVSSDVYIGESTDSTVNLPYFAFINLVKHFPNTAELNHYVAAKIARMVKEYLAEAEIHESRFEKFLERRPQTHYTTIGETGFSQQIKIIELDQLELISKELHHLLENAGGMAEKTWQVKIHDIIRVLYPKYIAAFREIKIQGTDGYGKYPDFLLVDADGYVDVVEIKKPDIQLLTKQSSYRNNYVPVREFAGAIQQIEKYVFCLSHWGKDGEKHLEKKLWGRLPKDIHPQIINPQGILILGRSKDFNSQQKNDFELIKRQYKHIADIISYDDLLSRIKNIILALTKALSDS